MTSHVDPVRFESAVGNERLHMAVHLRGCATCRRAVAGHDPTLLFAILAAAPMPRQVLEDLSTEVSRRAGTDRGSVGAIVAATPFARRRVAAAAVVALVLLSGYATLREPSVAPPPLAVVGQPPPIVPRRAGVDVHPARAVSQVVDFTVGETQVVMVYNGDLKL